MNLILCPPQTECVIFSIKVPVNSVLHFSYIDFLIGPQRKKCTYSRCSTMSSSIFCRICQVGYLPSKFLRTALYRKVFSLTKLDWKSADANHLRTVILFFLWSCVPLSIRGAYFKAIWCILIIPLRVSLTENIAALLRLFFTAELSLRVSFFLWFAKSVVFFLQITFICTLFRLGSSLPQWKGQSWNPTLGIRKVCVQSRLAPDAFVVELPTKVNFDRIVKENFSLKFFLKMLFQDFATIMQRLRYMNF